MDITGYLHVYIEHTDHTSFVKRLHGVKKGGVFAMVCSYSIIDIIFCDSDISFACDNGWKCVEFLYLT